MVKLDSEEQIKQFLIKTLKELKTRPQTTENNKFCYKIARILLNEFDMNINDELFLGMFEL